MTRCHTAALFKMIMMENRNLKRSGKYFLYFLRWIAIAVVLGTVGGAIGYVFHHFIDEATLLRGEYPWLLYLLPLIGLFIVFIQIAIVY